ncbi:MAG: alcohol dehydrogenase catalytic domain-containing protein [Verrucomicrobia bacterium]|nr:alcohol dehydrogenase catalytic domain-containing protein [Verrucomicrobiota bacterium]
MKALVKYEKGPGHVELRDVEEPRCAENQAKLEVGFCGICGTDLHVYNDTFRNFPPVILGHEFAGKIVETARNSFQFRPGDRVTVLGAMTVTCGRCVYCRKGEFMFCPERRGMGHGVNGAFTRYVAAREDQLFRLPDHLPSEEGAMVEPFAAAVHAVCEITELHFGDVALISGPGPIGLMCLKLLVANGVKTIVAGASADQLRLEMAKRLGAAVIVNVAENDLATVVKEDTDGFGVDVAFECAGAAASVANALNSVRPLGRYTQVGHFGKEITIPFDRVAFRQIRVAGSVGYTADSWHRALRILGDGRVKLGDLITHKLPLDDWQKGFAACEDKSALKVLLRP